MIGLLPFECHLLDMEVFVLIYRVGGLGVLRNHSFCFPVRRMLATSVHRCKTAPQIPKSQMLQLYGEVPLYDKELQSLNILLFPT